MISSLKIDSLESIELDLLQSVGWSIVQKSIETPNKIYKKKPDGWPGPARVPTLFSILIFNYRHIKSVVITMYKFKLLVKLVKERVNFLNNQFFAMGLRCKTN